MRPRPSLRSIFILTSGALILSLGLSCAEDQTYVDRGEVLNDVAELIVKPAYEAFESDSTQLQATISAFCESPDETKLKTAQDAWRSARQKWKMTESFEVGPVLDLQTRNKVDKKAVLDNKLDGLVAGTAEINAELVGKNSSYTRGFLALEYLIFPADGNNATHVAHLTAHPETGDRACLMAAAIAEYSANAATDVTNAWDAGSGDYLDIYLPQEDAEGVYASDKDGIDALFNCMLNHLADVLEYRLAIPAGLLDSDGTPDPEKVSTKLSEHGIQDILDNIDGIKLLLDGPESAGGTVGIGALIQGRKASLYSKMLDELETARAAVAAIPGPLSTAVVSNTDSVRSAYYALKDFHVRIGSDGATLLGISLSVNEVDND